MKYAALQVGLRGGFGCGVRGIVGVLVSTASVVALPCRADRTFLSFHCHTNNQDIYMYAYCNGIKSATGSPKALVFDNNSCRLNIGSALSIIYRTRSVCCYPKGTRNAQAKEDQRTKQKNEKKSMICPIEGRGACQELVAGAARTIVWERTEAPGADGFGSNSARPVGWGSAKCLHLRTRPTRRSSSPESGSHLGTT